MTDASCSRCKKPRSAWTENQQGFRAYCCWGCADNTGCICGRKTHRKSGDKEVKVYHADLFKKSRGRPSKS